MKTHGRAVGGPLVAATRMGSVQTGDKEDFARRCMVGVSQQDGKCGHGFIVL